MQTENNNIGRYVDGAVFTAVAIIVGGFLWMIASWISTESLHPISIGLVVLISCYAGYLAIRGDPVEVIEAFKKSKLKD